MNQQMHTTISQIITPLHVSTVSCHLQAAYNQYLDKLRQYFVPWKNTHNNFTNYHTATCFDIIVSSSGSL